jgi:hypothetical protein
MTLQKYKRNSHPNWNTTTLLVPLVCLPTLDLLTFYLPPFSFGQESFPCLPTNGTELPSPCLLAANLDEHLLPTAAAITYPWLHAHVFSPPLVIGYGTRGRRLAVGPQPRLGAMKEK